MNPYGIIKFKTKGRFRLGDRVRAMYSFPGAVGEIVEDRGPIGAGGRRYYHVRFTTDDEVIMIDWPEEELIPLGKDEGGKT